MAVYPIDPVAKPRMTRGSIYNAGKKKPAVARYHAFRDEVRMRRVKLPEGGYHVTFVLPMPKSWSKSKRREMNGQPHQQRPDKDNLEKALLDAIFDDDCRVWDGRVTKVWGEVGQIIVESGGHG